MVDNNVIKGTIYLHGFQDHFHQAITRALNLGPQEKQISFDITIDLLQSWKNKDVTYRIDYAYYGQNGLSRD